MNLTHDNINILLEKIKNKDIINLKVEPINKEFLFTLGILFAAGKKINILNKEELDLTTQKKSFYIMSYVWYLLSNDDFPKKDLSNVKTNLEIIVENFKRVGLTIKTIENNPIENKIFLICPVRNASIEQKQEMEDYVNNKKNEGYIIHAPHLDTVQKDILGGYSICLQNANAVATSSRIDIYYDQKSTGSVFDLGVAYYLNKPLHIINENKIVFKEDDFIDNLIKNWPYKQDIKIKKLDKE